LPLIRAELQRRKKPIPRPLIHDLSQVLYLPFDHDDGSYARDRSGYNNHGTIYGATLAAGKIGMARSFDRVDDYVEVPHSNPLNLTDAITVAVWCKIESCDSYAGIANKEPYKYGLWFNGYGPKGRGGVVTDVGVYFKNTVADIIRSPPEWVHFAMTYDRVEDPYVRFYVDGVEDGDPLPAAGRIDSGTLPFTIGKREALYTKGIIDEPRIYSKVLPAAEIPRLMHLRGI